LKKKGYTAICIVIVLSILLMFTFAEDMAKVVQGIESNARIIYNGKEADIGIKPIIVDGSNYLSVRVISSLFDKNIYWDQNKNEILITDKTNPQLEYLTSELAAKDRSIKELEEKVKKLENNMAKPGKLSIEELQEKINNEYGEYEGVSYKVILSGNEYEIRTIFEIDTSKDKKEWNSLSTNKRYELIEEVAAVIMEEYPSAKIKGYYKDISLSKKLAPFYYNWKSELVKGHYNNYSTISIIEERFNNQYDDYFKGVHFTFTLKGNDSNMEYKAYIQKGSFKGAWNSIPDKSVEIFMRKLCSEIKNEFKECYIYGCIYDTDGDEELAFCEQTVEGDFVFHKED